MQPHLPLDSGLASARRSSSPFSRVTAPDAFIFGIGPNEMPLLPIQLLFSYTILYLLRREHSCRQISQAANKIADGCDSSPFHSLGSTTTLLSCV